MPDNGGAFKITSANVLNGGLQERVLSEGYIGPRQDIEDPARPNLMYQRVQRWLIHDMARRDFAIAPYPEAPWEDKDEWLRYVARQWRPGSSVYAICLAEVYRYRRRDGTFLPDILPAPTFPAIETLPGGGGLLAGGEGLAGAATGGPKFGPKISFQMDIGYYQSEQASAERKTAGLARQVDQNFVRVIDYDDETGNLYNAGGQFRTVEYWVAPDPGDFTNSPALGPRFVLLESFPELVNRYPWVVDRLYLAVIGCITFTGLASPPEQPGEG